MKLKKHTKLRLLNALAKTGYDEREQQDLITAFAEEFSHLPENTTIPTAFYDFERNIRIVARQEGLSPEDVRRDLVDHVPDILKAFDFHQRPKRPPLGPVTVIERPSTHSIFPETSAPSIPGGSASLPPNTYKSIFEIGNDKIRRSPLPAFIKEAQPRRPVVKPIELTPAERAADFLEWRRRQPKRIAAKSATYEMATKPFLEVHEVSAELLPGPDITPFADFSQNDKIPSREQDVIPEIQIVDRKATAPTPTVPRVAIHVPTFTPPTLTPTVFPNSPKIQREEKLKAALANIGVGEDEQEILLRDIRTRLYLNGTMWEMSVTRDAQTTETEKVEIMMSGFPNLLVITAGAIGVERKTGALPYRNTEGYLVLDRFPWNDIIDTIERRGTNLPAVVGIFRAFVTDADIKAALGDTYEKKAFEKAAAQISRVPQISISSPQLVASENQQSKDTKGQVCVLPILADTTLKSVEKRLLDKREKPDESNATTVHIQTMPDYEILTGCALDAKGITGKIPKSGRQSLPDTCINWEDIRYELRKSSTTVEEVVKLCLQAYGRAHFERFVQARPRAPAPSSP